MAAVTNSHSPRSSGDGTVLNSPQSRRGRGVSSPWTHVVRGESESVISSAAGTTPSPVQEQIAVSTPPPDDSGADDQPDNFESGNDGSNAAKKPAWKKPSNGDVEVGPVMGAVSWPALSESTRASPKSSSSDSLKTLSDGSLLSLPASQGTGGAPSSSHKQAIANNANPNSTPNHVAPTRQKSMKRSGGNSSSGVSVNGGFPQPSPPQLEMPPNNSGKPGATAVESPSKEHSHKEAGQRGGFGSQSHGGSDHQQQRSSFRRGNGGPHPRGDGSYHHNYGGRQDRGNQDWNPHRNFGSRDTHMQHRVIPSPRGYIRPHTSTQFIPPPPVPVRPFTNPMVYPEVVSPMIFVQGPPPPDSLRGPIVPPMPPHAMFFSVPDPQLHTKIVNQIDYYFSNENLIKDTFLRQNMDDQGWVPIKLIAGFKKVMYLTDNIQLIMDSVRTSTVLEVQGDKVRRRNDWMKWIMPPVPFSTVSSPQPLGRSSHDMLLAGHLHSVTLDEKTTRQENADMYFSRSSSGEFNSHSQQQSGGEGAGQVTVQGGYISSK